MDDGENRSAERAVGTEEAFREANERIEATRRKLGLAGPIPYICECERERCTDLVFLDENAYSRARARPRRFLVARGHASWDARVLEDGGPYVVVEKPRQAGDSGERRS